MVVEEMTDGDSQKGVIAGETVKDHTKDGMRATVERRVAEKRIFVKSDSMGVNGMLIELVLYSNYSITESFYTIS